MSSEIDDGADCLIVEPLKSAEQAGLAYVSDDEPGITRRRAGKGFAYRDPQGDRQDQPPGDRRQRVEENLRDELPGLRAEEAAVLAFLQKRLAQQADEQQPSADATVTVTGPERAVGG